MQTTLKNPPRRRATRRWMYFADGLSAKGGSAIEYLSAG
ncbi:hypothetical protein D1BOALGB6SA_854 [Olavius sp. associated proteobacterium Delta 1]|nr:hypothetical protein D1BOALGB6SA_854 [Olavius sp. associated proteobacterium Delta 1]